MCDDHLLALSKLQNTNRSMRFNPGNGQGSSVTRVIDPVNIVTGKDFQVGYADRRVGDPAKLVADATMAK